MSNTVRALRYVSPSGATATGFVAGCLFPIGAIALLVMLGEPIDPVGLHRRFPLLVIIDLAPIVLAVAARWIGTLLMRSRRAESEQRRLAAKLAQVWSDDLAAHDAEMESLLRNGFRRTAAVSHELRTPLTAVTGFIEIMDSELDGHPAREYLDEIRSSCAFMLDLINEFLDAERSVAGVFKVEPKSVHLDDAVGTVLRLLSPVAAQRSLSLTHEADSDATVTADPRRLQQVLTNLIANSLNYTSDGGVIVSTAVHGDRAVIEVSDTGIGMTNEEAARIFAPFERGERGAAGGTGLGLSLARAMVEAMNGALSASSAGPGLGTTMRLELPLAQLPSLTPV